MEMKFPARNRRYPDIDKMSIIKTEQYEHIDNALKSLKKAHTLFQKLASLKVETTSKVHAIECDQCIATVTELGEALNNEINHLVQADSKNKH